MFEDYIGQLQMATIASIAVESQGKEISNQEIRAKLQPIQQVWTSTYSGPSHEHRPTWLATLGYEPACQGKTSCFCTCCAFSSGK
jgi:hypothetical protein